MKSAWRHSPDFLPILGLLLVLSFYHPQSHLHAQSPKPKVAMRTSSREGSQPRSKPLEMIISDLPEELPSSSRPTSDLQDRSPNRRPVISPPSHARDLKKRPSPAPANVARPKSGAKQTVMVVCPPAFLPAISTWINYREQQGYRIVHVDGRMTAVEILNSIRRYSTTHKVHYVVLVGDADLQMNFDPAIRERSVPTFVVASEINTELGVETHIATDNPYGDLNGDFTPDIAVGRISADSPEQLQVIIRKIIDYERMPRGGEWRRTIQLAAGVGDFGILADTIIEKAAKKLITDGIPPAYRTGFTYGNWRSPFCPDPRLFREHMLLQVEKGCLFWVYMGHGRAHRLDRFTVGNLLIPVLESRDTRRFRASVGMPIAVMLACYTGAFEQPRDCLAEELLRVPQGPVAVLASSRVAMPYSMSVLGTSLMETAFAPAGKGPTTLSRNAKEHDSDEAPFRVLGDIVLTGKRALTSKVAEGKNRKLMDSLAKALSPTKEKLDVERREHGLMFNLLGDPLLRIEVPRLVSISTDKKVIAGNKLMIRGNSPIGGRCLVELACRRDRMTFDFSRRMNLEGGHETLVGMNETYARANNQVWNRREVQLRAGEFAIEIDVPKKARGHAHARLMVEGDNDIALGATDVYIRMVGNKDELRTSNADR